MKNAWVMFSGAVGLLVMPLLGAPASAAAGQAAGNQSGMTVVAAEELNQRSKQPGTSEQGGMSERGVRNMVFYAFSLIPDNVKGPDGKMGPVDKSDPNKFMIPEEAPAASSGPRRVPPMRMCAGCRSSARRTTRQ